MRDDVKRVLEVAVARRNMTIAIGLSIVALAGSLYTLNAARRAAEADASWLRQRLADKRAVVRSLQADLAPSPRRPSA